MRCHASIDHVFEVEAIRPQATKALARGYQARAGGIARSRRSPERELAARLGAQGVVVEPGDVFFTGSRRPHQHRRIGYSSIPVDRIEAGVRLIARELAAMADR
jgi:DNA-binding transcriptional MocR family regulator